MSLSAYRFVLILVTMLMLHSIGMHAQWLPKVTVEDAGVFSYTYLPEHGIGGYLYFFRGPNGGPRGFYDVGSLSNVASRIGTFEFPDTASTYIGEPWRGRQDFDGDGNTDILIDGKAYMNLFTPESIVVDSLQFGSELGSSMGVVDMNYDGVPENCTMAGIYRNDGPLRQKRLVCKSGSEVYPNVACAGTFDGEVYAMRVQSIDAGETTWRYVYKLERFPRRLNTGNSDTLHSETIDSLRANYLQMRPYGAYIRTTSAWYILSADDSMYVMNGQGIRRKLKDSSLARFRGMPLPPSLVAGEEQYCCTQNKTIDGEGFTIVYGAGICLYRFKPDADLLTLKAEFLGECVLPPAPDSVEEYMRVARLLKDIDGDALPEILIATADDFSAPYRVHVYYSAGHATSVGMARADSSTILHRTERGWLVPHTAGIDEGAAMQYNVQGKELGAIPLERTGEGSLIPYDRVDPSAIGVVIGGYGYLLR